MKNLVQFIENLNQKTHFSGRYPQFITIGITMAVLSNLQVDWIKTENLDFISMIGAVCVIGGAIIAVFFAKSIKVAKA